MRYLLVLSDKHSQNRQSLLTLVSGEEKKKPVCLGVRRRCRRELAACPVMVDEAAVIRSSGRKGPCSLHLAGKVGSNLPVGESVVNELVGGDPGSAALPVIICFLQPSTTSIVGGYLHL